MSFLFSALLHLLRPLVPPPTPSYDPLPSAAAVLTAAVAASQRPAPAPSPNSILPVEEPPPTDEGPAVAFKLPPSQQDVPVDGPLPPATQALLPTVADTRVPVLSLARPPFWARAAAVLRIAISTFENIFDAQPARQPPASQPTYSYGPYPQRVIQGPSLSDAIVGGVGERGSPRGVVASRRRHASTEEASRSRWARLTSRSGNKPPRDTTNRTGLSEVLASPPGTRRPTRPWQYNAAAAAAVAGRVGAGHKENRTPPEWAGGRRAAGPAAVAARAAMGAGKGVRERKGARAASEGGAGAGVGVKIHGGRPRELGPSLPPARGTSAPTPRSGGRHAHFSRSLGHRPMEVVTDQAQPRHTYRANVSPPPSIYHHLPRAPLGGRTGAAGVSGWPGRRPRRLRRSMDLMVVTAAGATCLDE